MDELNLSVPTFGEVPWADDGNFDSLVASDGKASFLFAPPLSQDDLEIFSKAKNFQKLNLLSGNTVEGDISDYIVKRYGKVGAERLSFAKFVMNKLNLQPSKDMLLALSCSKDARVIIATAGAGKTTSLQIDLIISKMVDEFHQTGDLVPELVEGTTVTMPRILYLNYNKHNTDPILMRHQQLTGNINSFIKQKIRDDIESTTVHAFCRKWLSAFSDDLGITALDIITESRKEEIWQAVINPRWEKFYGTSSEPASYKVMDSLYTYKTESMQDWEEFFQSAKFMDTHLQEEFVKSCIKKYDSMKRSFKVMDFTDYLQLLVQALKEHPEMREKLQKRYSIIVADENQDFTALMNELLLQLYQPRVNKLIVVGDPDQTIYQFKGVSPDNVVRLLERLEDYELLGLDINYRCPDGIVDAAKRILDMNILRFQKPILTVRTGGAIRLCPCDSGLPQAKQVVRTLKKLGSAEINSTVVAYRNNSSALMVAEELYYAGIPFKMLDGSRPFSSLCFNHLFYAIVALSEKDDLERNQTLYHFLPLSKQQWATILKYNSDERRNHLHDLQFPKGMPQGTLEAYNALVKMSNMVDTAAVSSYIMPLIELYKKYYYNFFIKTTLMGSEPRERDPSLELERAEKFFKRDYTFDYMLKELNSNNRDCEEGLALGTFHALKGLEFDNVLAIDFNDRIFPNFSGIEMRYPKNTALEEEEAENRLCYVLVTRTQKTLYLFYSEGDPSLYIKILTGQQVDGEVIGDKDEVVLGDVSGSGNTTLSKMDFISRMLERT